MLLILLIGAAIAAAPSIDRQLLWLRIRHQHERCVRYAEYLLETEGVAPTVWPVPDSLHELDPKRDYWQSRADLVHELQRQTNNANAMRRIIDHGFVSSQIGPALPPTTPTPSRKPAKTLLQRAPSDTMKSPGASG